MSQRPRRRMRVLVREISPRHRPCRERGVLVFSREWPSIVGWHPGRPACRVRRSRHVDRRGTDRALGIVTSDTRGVGSHRRRVLVTVTQLSRLPGYKVAATTVLLAAMVG